MNTSLNGTFFIRDLFLFGMCETHTLLLSYTLVWSRVLINFTLAPAHREIDRCRYNNMAQLDCSNVTYEEVTANHFTSDTCSKPWYCLDREPLCTTFSTVFAKRYKEMVFILAHVRTDMNGAGVVDFVNHLKDGEWCIDKKFVSVRAFLDEHV
jgi:hypothetical protein